MVSNEKACGFSKTSFIVSIIKDELIKRCFHQRFHSFASRVQLKTTRDYHVNGDCTIYTKTQPAHVEAKRHRTYPQTHRHVPTTTFFFFLLKCQPQHYSILLLLSYQYCTSMNNSLDHRQGLSFSCSQTELGQPKVTYNDIILQATFIHK